MSSAFFFRLEKKRAGDRWVAILREPYGTSVSSPSDLCASFVTFYSSLLSASCTDSSVQGNQASECNGLFMLGECHSALLGMARSKTPGSDGVPMEFYIRFWEVLGRDLVDVLNGC